MSAIAIARTSVRRLLRDRRALFFLIVLPIFLIVILGNSIRGYSTFHVGVVDRGAGASGAQLVAQLRHASDLEVTAYPSLAAATLGVARGEVAAAVVLPRGMDDALRAGRPVHVGVMSERASSTQQAAVTAVDAVIAEVGGRVQAAQFAVVATHVGYARALSLADGLAAHIPQVAITTRQAEGTMSTLPYGYSYSAPTMLVLFVFISALSGGAMIVEVRGMRLYERMMAAPIRPRSVVAGEFLALLAVALLQSALIVGVGTVCFGVSWGSPAPAIALVVLWAVVAASAGMLAGTLFRTPEQATALAPSLGIVFGMLGGCMWPLSIVSTAFRESGHAVPQAWAVDAWTDLLARGGTLGTIAVPLAILTGFALVFLVLAGRRLRRWLV